MEGLQQPRQPCCVFPRIPFAISVLPSRLQRFRRSLFRCRCIHDFGVTLFASSSFTVSVSLHFGDFIVRIIGIVVVRSFGVTGYAVSALSSQDVIITLALSEMRAKQRMFEKIRNSIALTLSPFPFPFPLTLSPSKHVENVHGKLVVVVFRSGDFATRVAALFAVATVTIGVEARLHTDMHLDLSVAAPIFNVAARLAAGQRCVSGSDSATDSASYRLLKKYQLVQN